MTSVLWLVVLPGQKSSSAVCNSPPPPSTAASGGVQPGCGSRVWWEERTENEPEDQLQHPQYFSQVHNFVLYRVVTIASYPGLLAPVFVACSTNAGEGLVKLSHVV